MGLLELAAASLRGGERRVEIASQNAVNADTPGYKMRLSLSEIRSVEERYESNLIAPSIDSYQTDSQSVLFHTENAFDFAINGSGYLLLRQGEEFSLTRGGQFSVGSDGSIIDAQGRILQLATGGDAQSSTSAVEILPDGTMLDGEAILGSIGIFEPGDNFAGSAMSEGEASALDQANDSEIKQGMLERSNVTLSDEMIELMRAQRQIESGAQLIRAYDQLLDRAISTFGRNS